jgi:hypothetical protein
MKSQFLLAGVLASLFARRRSVFVMEVLAVGSFGGGGFHGGSPRGFQGGNMSFQGADFTVQASLVVDLSNAASSRIIVFHARGCKVTTRSPAVEWTHNSTWVEGNTFNRLGVLS